MIVLSASLFSCGSQQPTASVFTTAVDSIKAENFSKTIDGKEVRLYTLVGKNGIGMKVTNFGARVIALCVADTSGKPVDIVLGYNTLNEYINNPESYFGAAIGRYGNRIGGAKFSLDSTEYQLPVNNGPNHLHGGPKGFFDVVWDAEQLSDSKIIFKYLSPDGDQGYPGNLNVTMTYELTLDNALKIDYEATANKPTVCNLTHHSYFNLSGEGAETINDHVLMIKAKGYTPVDSTLIPIGDIAEVANTPFDFNQPTEIGKRVNEEIVQLKFGGGYDHNWVLSKEKDGEELICSVYSPITKINMDVFTDQPGIQFYGGNFIDGTQTGKSGKNYRYRSAFCLETQHYPDSPNKPDFPSVRLNPSKTYRHTCSYRFSIEE
ncbi:MAG: galactose mutarotase [Chloroflexia bacterium]|nr:galactose mutarotase [Chloroflexia bacterium]